MGLAIRGFAFVRWISAAILGLALVTNAESQSREPSSNLIALLTRPDALEQMGMVTPTCSENLEDRAAAKSLAEIGASVVPEIGKALSLLESGTVSDTSPHIEWLLYAYAKIDGLSAFPRLRRMMGNSRLAFLASAWDNSIAVSLGITSYVSKFHPAPRAMFLPNQRIIFCNDQEPRFALDQLILAWERNDPELLERSLGPRAKAALNSILESRSWEDLRAEILIDNTSDVAVGYRFNVASVWSMPAGMLDERVVEDSADPELETQFKNRSGRECGNYQVKFVGDGRAFGDGSMAYQVDNPNVGDLLRLISFCGAQ